MQLIHDFLYYFTFWFSRMACFSISLAGFLSSWLSCFPSGLNLPSRNSSPRSSTASHGSHQRCHSHRPSSIIVLPSSDEINEYYWPSSQSPQPPISMKYESPRSAYLQSIGTYSLSLTSFTSSVLI